MKQVQDVATKVLVVVLGAAAIAYAGLPSRVTVLESKFDGIDKKLDQIIVIMSHRRN